MFLRISNISEALQNNLSKINQVTNLAIADFQASIQQIEAVLKEAKNIDTFFIYHDTIEELPKLQEYTQLINFTVNCPALKEIRPEHFPPATNYFTYQSGNLSTIPDFIWRLENLQSMRIVHRSITDIHIPSGASVRYLIVQSDRLQRLRCSGSIPILHSLNVSSQSLEVLDESLSNIQEITTLEIKAPINTVHCDFSQIKNIKGCRLEGWDLEDFSFLNQLSPELGRLEITKSKRSWYHLPAITKWKNLTAIHLENCHDDNLSPALSADSPLQRVNFVNCKFQNITPLFAACSKLRHFFLTDMEPIRLEDCFKYLAGVVGLNFENVSLEGIDFVPETTCAWRSFSINTPNLVFQQLDFLDFLPDLREFFILNTKISSPLLLLRKKAVPIPYLDNVIEGLKFKDAKKFCSLCAAVAKSNLDQSLKEELVLYFAGHTKLELNKQWGWSKLLEVSNITHTTLRKTWKGIIEQKIAKQFDVKSLNSKAVIYCSGKVKLKKTEMKKIIQEMGMTLATQYTEAVTHVLIGTNSPDAAILGDKEFIPMTDTLLQQAYADTQEQFLKENANEEGGKQLIENLSNLLRSNEDNSVLLAMEMIKNGGMPEQVFEPLLIVNKTTASSKIRKMTKEVLEVHAPTEWQGLIRDRLSFKAVHSNKSEVEIRRQFKTLAKRIPPAQVAEFSCMMYRHTGRGLRYAITAGLAKAVKKKAYAYLLKDHHFDFSKGLGFSKWVRDFDYFANYAFPETSVALPTLALEMDTIHSLNLTNCRYDAVPPKITKFKDLKRLTFAQNNLGSIPDFFEELVNLEHLDLSSNNFKRFPEVLNKLPQLKTLNWADNHDTEIPDSFKRANPNCEIIA